MLFIATLARAAHAHADSHDIPENTLKHHRFLTAALIPSPFVSTNVAFRQGVVSLSVPDFPLTTNRSYDVQGLGITERLSAGVRFLEILQASLFAQGELLTGNNARSIILAGTTYDYAIGGGLAARIIRSENTGTELSARAQFTGGPLGELNVIAFANSIIDRPGLALQDLFSLNVTRSALASGSQTNLHLDALIAQTLTRNFGVQAFLGFAGAWESIKVYDPQQDQDVHSHANSYSPEGGLSVDATLPPGVPVGFHLEYAFTSQRRTLSDTQGAQSTHLLQSLALGVHVVDARFQVGLTIGSVFGLGRVERTGLLNRQLTSGTPTNLFGQFGMQYLW